MYVHMIEYVYNSTILDCVECTGVIQDRVFTSTLGKLSRYTYYC